MKNKIINIALILIGIIIFFYIFNYYKNKQYEYKKDFFVSQCKMAFYDDSEYTESDEIISSFIKNMDKEVASQEIKDKIEHWYNGDYIAYLDISIITNFCENFFVGYNERQEEESYRSDFCSNNICR
jgi:hypothetical protein